MKIFRTLGLLLLVIFPDLYSQTDEQIDWDYEIDLLARELAKKHPDLFFGTDSTWYYNQMSEVAAVAPGQSVFQVSVRLQQVLAAMGDAQTQINYHFLIDKSRILPLEFYWFEEGIYVLRTDRLYEPLLGKKLTAINRVPLEVVVDSLATLLVPGNPAVLYNSIPRMLTWFQLLEFFGFTSDESLSLTVRNDAGEVVEIVIGMPVELGEMLEVSTRDRPLGWQDQKTYFRDLYFGDEHMYYIQYNQCWSREAEEDYGSGASALFMPSFKEFEKEVYPVLKKKEIEKLVFDMRFNKGGYAGQGTEFIHNICKALSKKQLDIFVLIGRATSEEAITNTLDFVNSAKVILVGEPTSGRPNYFGEVMRFVLPESRLIVSYATAYFSLLEEDQPALFPDIQAPVEFRQYINGIDPALEAVRHYRQP
jgi:hypothetical protein